MVVVVVINRAARTRSYPQAVIIILDEECNMHLDKHTVYFIRDERIRVC